MTWRTVGAAVRTSDPAGVVEEIVLRARTVAAMGHAYYGLHLIVALNATLRFAANIGIDFTLGRDWKRSSCAALKPR